MCVSPREKRGFWVCSFLSSLVERTLSRLTVVLSAGMLIIFAHEQATLGIQGRLCRFSRARVDRRRRDADRRGRAHDRVWPARPECAGRAGPLWLPRSRPTGISAGRAACTVPGCAPGCHGRQLRRRLYRVGGSWRRDLLVSRRHGDTARRHPAGRRRSRLVEQPGGRPRFDLDAPESDVVATMLRLAAGDMSEPALTKWLRQHLTPYPES